MADVCVIGAGLAGLYLATGLRALGCSVVVVEAGGPAAVDGSLSQVTFTDSVYDGALGGRALGLGGTSTRWGGQLAPMAEHELANCLPRQSSRWPLDVAELNAPYEAVLRRFGISPRVHALIERTESAPNDSMFISGSAFSLPSGRRNVSRLWKREIQEDASLRVVLGGAIGSVTASGNTGHRRVECMDVATHGGSVVRVNAGTFVLSAGALGSTQFYLRHFAHRSDGFIAGRGLQDHLSFTVGDVHVRDRNEFASRFSPIVDYRGVRFQRWFTHAEFERQHRLPGAFLHVVYDGDAGLPYWLHDAQTLRQRGEWASLASHLVRGAGRMGQLVSVAAGVASTRRIHWPRDTRFRLMLDVEQLPDPENVVSLDSRGELKIAWRPRVQDLDAQRALAQCAAQWWSESGNDRIARLDLRAQGAEMRTAYHPTGTLRMSRLPEDGVVDAQCRMHGFSNGYILSTATFPRCGAANPSYTLLAMAQRMSEHLASTRS